MGTEELKIYPHSMSLSTTIIDGILQILKDTEEQGGVGSKKKEIAIGEIIKVFPKFYADNQQLVSVLIDSFVLISNNPFVIQAEKKCLAKCFSCCK